LGKKCHDFDTLVTLVIISNMLLHLPSTSMIVSTFPDMIYLMHRGGKSYCMWQLNITQCLFGWIMISLWYVISIFWRWHKRESSFRAGEAPEKMRIRNQRFLENYLLYKWICFSCFSFIASCLILYQILTNQFDWGDLRLRELVNRR
jgi:hypothetical protein